MGIKNSYEAHHKIVISEKNIEDIVHLTNKYVKNKSNPDKSIELLDMICANKKMKGISLKSLAEINEKINKITKEKEQYIYQDDYDKAALCKEKENDLRQKLNTIKNSYENKINYNDILEVLAKYAKLPLLQDKKQTFTNLKNNLKEKIWGQEKAVQSILKNIWIKLNVDNKPLSLLLTGPSGVGKTETVKIIADSLFLGNLIRIDMSEYNLDTSVNKLIGVSAGYVGYDDSYLFQKVLENPYSILLVDEIEKAHPRVLNLFLQILDEGFVTSARGEKIDFSNTMIFMTSNVVNKNSVGFVDKENNNFNEIFSKEFLGRFNDIICYKELSPEILEKYINTNLKNNKIKAEDILKEANCKLYGLRNLKHLIDKYNSELDIETLYENMV